MTIHTVHIGPSRRHASGPNIYKSTKRIRGVLANRQKFKFPLVLSVGRTEEANIEQPRQTTMLSPSDTGDGGKEREGLGIKTMGLTS